MSARSNKCTSVYISSRARSNALSHLPRRSCVIVYSRDKSRAKSRLIKHGRRPSDMSENTSALTHLYVQTNPITRAHLSTYAQALTYLHAGTKPHLGTSYTHSTKCEHALNPVHALTRPHPRARALVNAPRSTRRRTHQRAQIYAHARAEKPKEAEGRRGRKKLDADVKRGISRFELLAL